MQHKPAQLEESKNIFAKKERAMPPLFSKPTFCKLDNDVSEANDRGAITANENMAASKKQKR